MNIRLHCLRRLPAYCRKPSLFARACRAALGRKAGEPGELSIVFASNPELRRINKRFLSHDFDTDVIAFPFNRKPAFGDIYISVDQAKVQAEELGHPLIEELLTLAIHGALHLMGFDDRRPEDRRRMFSKQDRIIKSLKLGRSSRGRNCPEARP